MATYKEIPGYPGYRVGDDGTVWSRWVSSYRGTHLGEKWRQIRTPPGSKGYLRCNLIRDGIPQTFRVHRLVLEAFVGPCPEGLQCRHLDGSKTNNVLSNLAWGSPEENYDDIRKHDGYGNRPRNRRYAHDGREMSLKQWASHLNVSYACLYQRVTKLGMSFSDAISRPFLGLAGNGGKNRRLTRSEQ